MTAWILFYDDGSTFSSDDGPADKAYGYGMICGAQEDTRKHPGVANVSWVTFAGEYVYFSLPDQYWRPAQSWADIEDLILHRKPITAVCKGRTCPDETFWPIWNRCQEWATAHGLRRKDGFDVSERAMAGKPLE